ncbi:hypothetical protein J6V85_00760 [Candidatus Saccharibacteria bacterium]|nr:hypothetical protein [Candidatus Saccharibacteria bacterium]
MSEINGLEFDNENNKLILKNKAGETITDITIAFATNATNAVNATNAENAERAGLATIASQDVNEKLITSYVADASLSESNVLALKDSLGNTIRSLSLTPASVIATLNGYYKSGEKTVFDSDLAVGDEIVVLTDVESETDISGFIDTVIDGQVGSVCVYDSTKTYPNFFSSCYALKRTGSPAVPLVSLTAIYGEESGGGVWSNIKWRLFHMYAVSGQIEGKYAFKLKRVD